MTNNIKKLQQSIEIVLAGNYKNKDLMLELLYKKLDKAFLES